MRYGYGGGYGYQNPIQAGIESFKAVNDIFRDERKDTRDEQDRQRKLAQETEDRAFLAKQRTQQEQSWDRENEKGAIDLKKAKAEEDARILQGLGVKIASAKENGGKLDVAPDEMDVVNRYMKGSPLFSQDPKERGVQLGALQTVRAKMDDYTAKLMNLGPNQPRVGLTAKDDPELFDAFNVAFGKQINKGDGGQKRIVGANIDRETGTVGFVLDVTRPDGTTYEAPMTYGRSTSPDDPIVEAPLDMLQGYIESHIDLGNMEQVVNAARVKAGDKTAVEDVQAKKTAKLLRTRAEGLDGVNKERVLMAADIVENGGKATEGAAVAKTVVDEKPKKEPKTIKTDVGKGLEQTFQYNEDTGRYDIPVGKPGPKFAPAQSTPEEKESRREKIQSEKDAKKAVDEALKEWEKMKKMVLDQEKADAKNAPPGEKPQMSDAYLSIREQQNQARRAYAAAMENYRQLTSGKKVYSGGGQVVYSLPATQGLSDGKPTAPSGNKGFVYQNGKLVPR